MVKRTEYDYLVKLLVIGDSGVGKTCMLLRFADDTFNPSHLATIGIDFKIKNLEVDNQLVKLQIVRFSQWDTAGQERFRTITQTYYKGAMGVVIAFDCTDETSFRNVQSWVQQVRDNASPTVICVLVATKCDRPDRKVTPEQAESLAQELGFHLFETSAKSNINVQETFLYIARQVRDHCPELLETGLRLRRAGKSMICC